MAVRRAKYLGSFPVAGGEHSARVDDVTRRLHEMKETARAVPVLIVVALSGVEVCDPEHQSVRMSHALRRISYATCEAARALFALVAREPSAPSSHHCHAFHTASPQQAEELNSLVGDAFRMAFASQLQPTAPLWSKELSSDCGMGVRAPDSLPGLKHHYPHCLDRSSSKCDMMGLDSPDSSPSSSEESPSPTELSCYRRLGAGGGGGGGVGGNSVMKRLALGLSGALLHVSDDDSTPLVAVGDTPTTPTTMPVCVNGGYMNEASEPPPARTRQHHMTDFDTDFMHCNNLNNSSTCSPSVTCSASSSGASCTSADNNNEPELKDAPWFQLGIPREIALEVLSRQAAGAFLVRGSSQRACLALSVRVPRAGIAHYLILRTRAGYKIKGFTKEFRTLSALVTHHSVMPELLPVPLRLPRARRVPPAAAPDDFALLPPRGSTLDNCVTLDM